MSVRFDSAGIAAATGGEVVRPGPVGPISFDSRHVRPGEWFYALAGERVDAHDFLDDLPRDAAGLVVSRPDRVPADWTAGVVRVAGGTGPIADLGRAARDRITHPVVGLTGSAGKTTTRAFVALALSPLGPIHQTTGNLNNHLGVPFTLLATPSASVASVIEMGTSAPGEIAFLAHLARPDIRLVVNVGPAHLEELGGIAGVAREKGALFASAREGDVICVNADDPHVAAMPHPPGARVIRWGRAPDADVRLLKAEVDADNLATDAMWDTPEGRVTVRIPALGVHLAHNATGALAVAYALGVGLSAAAEAFRAYEPVGMRLRAEPLPKGGVALNDAYNANPLSMEASLRLVASLGNRRAAVLGDMLELGDGEAAYHTEIVRLACSLNLELVVLVGPRMAAAASACPDAWVSEDGETLPDGRSLADKLRKWLRKGDRVLFKGSRGARVERILQNVVREP